MFYKGDEVLSAGAIGRLVRLWPVGTAVTTVTPQLRRPRTFRAHGFGSQRHGSADKQQLKQRMRIGSCNLAPPFEESWPNPTDAPEEAGTQIQLAGELMLSPSSMLRQIIP